MGSGYIAFAQAVRKDTTEEPTTFDICVVDGVMTLTISQQVKHEWYCQIVQLSSKEEFQALKEALTVILEGRRP